MTLDVEENIDWTWILSTHTDFYCTHSTTDRWYPQPVSFSLPSTSTSIPLLPSHRKHKQFFVRLFGRTMTTSHLRLVERKRENEKRRYELGSRRYSDWEARATYQHDGSRRKKVLFSTKQW